MPRLVFCFVVAALSTCAIQTSALKILGITTLPSPSHHIWFTQLMKGLARNGHEIYALALQPTKFDDDRVAENRTTSIVFEGVMDKVLKSGDSNAVEWAEKSEIDMMWFIYEMSNQFCEMQIVTEGAWQALQFVRNNTIDVIVQDFTIGQCFYALFEVAQGNPAIVGFTPFGFPSWVKDVVGGGNWPAIKQYSLLRHAPPFSLWEKIVNFVYYEIDDMMRQYWYMPIQQKLAEKYIGKKMSKSLNEIEKRVSVLLINTYAALDPPIFLPPNAIEVGGLHITGTKPLPEDIEEFLDGAENGVIVLSLGTNLKSSNLGSKKLEMILTAVSGLKQRVLWKFDADHLPNKPKNVMIRKWLPQNDVLAHPKVRVLWSHSGLLSTQEAVWRGVPMIGMPFYMDQYANIELLVKKGVALRLDFESLTVQSISETLDKILTDRSFALRMKQLSSEYRDRPMSPSDLAVWHVEYAARHPRGPHATPGRDLNRLQLNLLDVYAVLGFAVLAVLRVFWFILRSCLRRFQSRQENENRRKLKFN